MLHAPDTEEGGEEVALMWQAHRNCPKNQLRSAIGLSQHAGLSADRTVPAPSILQVLSPGTGPVAHYPAFSWVSAQHAHTLSAYTVLQTTLSA